MHRERGRRVALEQARPLDPMERLRNVCDGFLGRVQAHRHDEGAVASHHVATLIRKIPLETEVALVPRRRVRRDDRHEERAVADLAPDPLIPHLPATQLALVEPHFDASLAQRAADASRCCGILRGVADENAGRATARLLVVTVFGHCQPPTGAASSRMAYGLATGRGWQTGTIAIGRPVRAREGPGSGRLLTDSAAEALLDPLLSLTGERLPDCGL